MTSLYELTTARLALQTKLQELDFDIETIADTLEGAGTAIEAKIEDYGFVIRNRKSLAESMTLEIKRMTERRDAELKRVNHIEAWLLANMVACNFTKIECPAFTIALQNNPQSVVIDSESLIPGEFWKMHEAPPPSLNKAEIAKALKAGGVVAGAHLEQTKRLVIK